MTSFPKPPPRSALSTSEIEAVLKVRDELTAVLTQVHACQKPRPRIHDRADRQKATTARWEAAKREVWRRDGSRCRACNRRVKRGSVASLDTGHVHHLKPRSAGRDDDPENLVLVCAFCHADIGAHALILSGRASALVVERS